VRQWSSTKATPRPTATAGPRNSADKHHMLYAFHEGAGPGRVLGIGPGK